jgi:endoglucanase
MSRHGLQWYGWNGWNKCITEGSLDALATDWGADAMRVSMYVQEGDYEKDPAGFTSSQDEKILPKDCTLRRVKYLYNIIEQDY